jgi:RHS repeat-associated protein
LLGVYDANSGDVIEELVYLDDTPVATLRAGAIYFIHGDPLGTPRIVTDDAQNIIWRWDSDPFGEAAPDQDSDGDGTDFVFNLRFPGQYYDAETKTHYNYFRDYNPATGRYTQSDPIGLSGGLNTYLYVNGNPVRYTDPQGLICGTGACAAVVAVVTAYGRCLAECAIIEGAVAALGGTCPGGLAAAAASCVGDCLNPLNWLPGSKVFKAAKKARRAKQVYEAKKAADRARKAREAAKKVADAAKRLGVKLDGIPINNGVARTKIDLSSALDPKDIIQLKDVLRSRGATRAEVDTGFIANEKLDAFLRRRVQDGKPFNGGKVRFSNSKNSDFTIDFDL